MMSSIAAKAGSTGWSTIICMRAKLGCYSSRRGKTWTISDARLLCRHPALSCLNSLQQRHSHSDLLEWDGARSPSSREVGVKWWWESIIQRRETVPLTDTAYRYNSQRTHHPWGSVAPASRVAYHAAHASATGAGKNHDQFVGGKVA